MGGFLPFELCGCKPAAKNKKKVRLAVDNGFWNKLSLFFYFKFILNDPELIEPKSSKIYGFWILVLNYVTLVKFTP